MKTCGELLSTTGSDRPRATKSSGLELQINAACMFTKGGEVSEKVDALGGKRKQNQVVKRAYRQAMKGEG